MVGSPTSPPDAAASGERADLLATKLNIPRARELLGRSRLTERLNEGMTRELLLVCTPAGFGKTTLVAADWHRGRMGEAESGFAEMLAEGRPVLPQPGV